jgi:hypothetical protein
MENGELRRKRPALGQVALSLWPAVSRFLCCRLTYVWEWRSTGLGRLVPFGRPAPRRPPPRVKAWPEGLGYMQRLVLWQQLNEQHMAAEAMGNSYEQLKQEGVSQGWS